MLAVSWRRTFLIKHSASSNIPIRWNVRESLEDFRGKELIKYIARRTILSPAYCSQSGHCYSNGPIKGLNSTKNKKENKNTWQVDSMDGFG